MSDFKKGETVFIRDFALGRASRIHGKVVGLLPNDYYNILLTSGLNEGNIIRYKSFNLIKKEDTNV